MRGTKRKIAMEKIQNKDSRSVTFSKRRNGLYSKASELCQLSGAQIAILTTPISSNSNVAFYSYGHSSVDCVVSAFLADERPPKEDLGFWFEDESLIDKLNDPKELSEAADSISKMLQNLKGMCLDLENHEDDVKKKKKKNNKKKNVSETLIHQQDLSQTLTHQLASTSTSIHEHSDPPTNFEGFVENREVENQIVPISENLDDFDKLIGFVMSSEGMCLDFEVDDISDSKLAEDEALPMLIDSDEDQIVVCNQKLDDVQQIDEVSMNRNTTCSDSNLVEDETLMMMMHRDSDHEDQIVSISDNSNNASLGDLGECNRELNLRESYLINLEMEDDDFMMKMSQDLFFGSEDSLHLYDVFSDSKVVEYEALPLKHRDSDKDQITPVTDNNNNNNASSRGDLDEINKEIDLAWINLEMEDDEDDLKSVL